MANKKYTFAQYCRDFKANPSKFCSIENPEYKKLTRKQFAEICERARTTGLLGQLYHLMLESHVDEKDAVIKLLSVEEANEQFLKDLYECYSRSE